MRQGGPIGILLRSKLPSAGMKRVASRFGSEWMKQKPAGLRLARDHQLRSALEILAGLFFRPVGEARREGRAAVAARVPHPLLQKDGLHAGFEELKIKLAFGWGVRSRSCRS